MEKQLISKDTIKKNTIKIHYENQISNNTKLDETIMKGIVKQKKMY